MEGGLQQVFFLKHMIRASKKVVENKHQQKLMC